MKSKTLTSAVSVLSLFLLVSGVYAKAALIKLDSGTSQTSTTPAYFGQSFTIPGTGQFDNITFNFFDSQGDTVAVGHGYLFSSFYNGNASDLDTIATLQLPNFLGSANSMTQGYTFSPTLTLNAGTTYYFYEDHEFSQLPAGTPYTGGFISMSEGGPFLTFDDGQALNFEVFGSFPIVGVPPGVTPEPSSLLLLDTGILALAGAARRKFLLHS